MIAAAAALFAACSNTDTFKDSVNESKDVKVLSFSAFADKATKADDSNNLKDFYKVFAVYGWKTVNSTIVDNPVFENTPNEYFASDAKGSVVYDGTDETPSKEWALTDPFNGGWFYENLRYWDKLADSYQFFAIAPYEASPKYDVSADDNNFSIYTDGDKYDISDEYNLARTVFGNTITTDNAPKSELTYFGFKKDYMIADKSEVTATNYASDVTLTFHHILTKLNVNIKKSDTYKGQQNLKINKLEIGNLDKEGYFVYNTSGMTSKGWTSDDKARTITIGTSYSLANDPNNNNYDGNYWIETLMFPQVATCKSVNAQADNTGLSDIYLYIEYQIGDEVFKAWYDFAHIWNKNLEVNGTYEFLQGNQYTLTLTVGPEPIHFAPTVTKWIPQTKNWSVDTNNEITPAP
jgi:hypothetical protein